MNPNLIPAKVNEGRLIAALSLEQLVLANGVLPNSPLMERVSLVKGIVTGLLEQGQWNDAVRLVYQDGSPARALFDGDWEGLRKDILASVQKPQRFHYIGDKVAELLIKHDEAGLLYDIACILPLETKEFKNIMEMVDSKLPQQQMKDGYNTLAVRAQEQQKFGEAYAYYQKAENTEAVDWLYQNLFEHFVPVYLDTLLTIAEETNTTLNSRVAQTVYAVLQKPELLQFSRDASRRLTNLVREHKIALSTSRDDMLKDALVSKFALYELKDIAGEDPSFSLRWAKSHAQSDPKDAYGVFKSRKYVGPEVATAVQQGLINNKKHDHYQGLAPTQIEESHLRQTYDSLSLECKVTVAVHLKDSALLQDLSRQYKRQKKVGSIETAYRLWIMGDGDQQDPYVEGLRSAMIEKELKDAHQSAGLFLPEDKVGNRHWYLEMIQRDPTVAYGIAKRIDDSALISEVRILMVKKSPLDALHKFQSHRHEDTDVVGVNMALDALARQYNVARGKIDEYLALEK